MFFSPQKGTLSLLKLRQRDIFHSGLLKLSYVRVASSVVEHPAFNRLVLSSNLRRPIFSKQLLHIVKLEVPSKFFKINFFFSVLLIAIFTPASAGLDRFTNLIFFDEWLIERKINSSTNEIKCRASIPSHANWFGARVRLGPTNELITPTWISVDSDFLHDSKLNKIVELLRDCRAGPLFLPEKI